MKKILRVLLVAVFSTFLVVGNATAIPFSGNISFSGYDTVDNSNLNVATQFLTFSSVTVGSGDGQYAGVASGTSVTFTPFVFRPAAASVVPLWTFAYGGNTYSFDATSMAIAFSSVSNIVIEGSGTGYINSVGFASPGIWSVTANTAGTTATFSSSAAVPAVPEPTSLLLLGLGLVGLGIASRRKGNN